MEAARTDDPMLRALDPGERSAIALAILLKAHSVCSVLILIDERRGSSVALSKGLESFGTLGVLDLAARRGLIDLEDVVNGLKKTNFRYRRELVDEFLLKFNETRK